MRPDCPEADRGGLIRRHILGQGCGPGETGLHPREGSRELLAAQGQDQIFLHPLAHGLKQEFRGRDRTGQRDLPDQTGGVQFGGLGQGRAGVLACGQDGQIGRASALGENQGGRLQMESLDFPAQARVGNEQGQGGGRGVHGEPS